MNTNIEPACGTATCCQCGERPACPPSRLCVVCFENRSLTPTPTVPVKIVRKQTPRLLYCPGCGRRRLGGIVSADGKCPSCRETRNRYPKGQGPRCGREEHPLDYVRRIVEDALVKLAQEPLPTAGGIVR
jgi:hypothetical protein